MNNLRVNHLNLNFNTNLSDSYKSNSQKIRVMSEAWVADSIFCPSCGGDLSSYENNRPVADLFCAKCKEDYELKSKKNNLGNKINDGAYQTMYDKVSLNQQPSFFFLSYRKNELSVNNFMVVPKPFFRTEMIEKRKPLSSEAKRAGWTGCNILFNSIPESGKIFYIKDGIVEPKNKVIDSWAKTIFLRPIDSTQKGWLLDIMNIVEKLNKKSFALRDVYGFVEYLKIKHPENNNIEAKIRQQLQVLRDSGYLKFTTRGLYEVI